MGRGHDGKGGLAHREGIRQEHRRGEVGAARSATGLCSALPRIGRRVGADPISFGARFGANDRTLPWGASSEFDQPSMIALGSSRTLDVAALVVEGLPTTRPEVSYPLHIDQWQILIARARFARCTSK